MCRRPAVSATTTSDAARRGRVQGVVDDGRGIRAGGVGDHRQAGALAHISSCSIGRRAERVTGGQQDLGATLWRNGAQLGHGRGLARAVDADDEHDSGHARCRNARPRSRVARREQGEQLSRRPPASASSTSRRARARSRRPASPASRRRRRRSAPPRPLPTPHRPAARRTASAPARQDALARPRDALVDSPTRSSHGGFGRLGWVGQLGGLGGELRWPSPFAAASGSRSETTRLTASSPMVTP